ncbi:MAG: type II RES/Xre toxin-antitoxin system antitoxin [Blastocatellia bacterium]
MISEERISEVLGAGRTPTSKRAFKPVPLREQVRAGFRFSALEAFQRRYRLSPEQLRELIDISERTISRRRQEQRLTKSESDRLYRVARVAALAEDMFGSPAAVESWLKEPNPALGHVTPLSLMDTDEGTQTVTDILGRIEHGVYS